MESETRVFLHGFVPLQHILPPSVLCSSPLPIWTGHDFSFCFQDLVFGCAANLVTLLLIVIYSKRCSAAQKQKIKKSMEFFGLRRAMLPEILLVVCSLLTVWQGIRLVLRGYDASMEHPRHTFLFVCLQGLAWVSSCWLIHYDYAVVMANYWYLRLWWLFSPILHIPFLHSIFRESKVMWTSELLMELLLFLTSSTFGLSTFVIGIKISSMIHLKNREFPLLTESLLKVKHLQADSRLPVKANSLWQVLFFTWVTPLMDLGTTRQLEYNDLLAVPENLDPKNCSKWLLTSWAEEQRIKGHGASLFHAIYLVYRWQYLYIGIVKVVLHF